MKAFSTLALLLLASEVLAGPHDVAINVTRIGGDAAAAQPYVDRFLGYVEKAAGWASGTTKGAFLTTRKAVVAFVESSHPGLGMVEPPLFFEMRKEWGLKPMVQVESNDLVSERLHVVVKDLGIRTLSDLKGKRVWTTLGDYPRYLSRVVLKGAADAAKDFQLKHIQQALKGVRGVLRGDCDATLLDDEQLANARKMEGGAELRVIYTSDKLPGIPVVAFGDGLPAAERETLVKVLLSMCSTEAGGAICREMHVGRFVPLDKAAFDAAQKLFGD